MLTAVVRLARETLGGQYPRFDMWRLKYKDNGGCGLTHGRGNCGQRMNCRALPPFSQMVPLPLGV